MHSGGSGFSFHFRRNKVMFRFTLKFKALLQLSCIGYGTDSKKGLKIHL